MSLKPKNKKIWIIAIVSTVAMVLYAWLIFGSIKGQILNRDMSEGAILDGHFGFGRETAEHVLAQLSEQGLNAYLRMLTIWDAIFPLLYGFMYVSWLLLIFKVWQDKYKWTRWIIYFPLLPAVADWFENYAIAQLVKAMMHQGKLAESSIQLASVSTQIKWSLSFMNYLIIIAGSIALILHHRIKGKTTA